MQPIVIAALYKFVPMQSHEALREPLKELCEAHQVRGILLLAHEGINGTVAGPREGIDALLGFLRGQPGLEDLLHKESFADEQPFIRMKVRLKQEIVTMGVPSVDPLDKVGTYVDPQDWNDIIADPEVVLVDTRNDYEVRVGTFEGAIDPDITSFRDFPAWVDANFDPSRHKKVAMFCTGGIRCEKASSYLLSKGFETVFHLKGGILKYFEEVPTEQSAWKGDCFVFDGRIAVDQELKPSGHTMCFGCRAPLDAEDRAHPAYERHVSCPYCDHTLDDDKRQALRERAHQLDLAAERGQRHMGPEAYLDGKADKAARKEADRQAAEAARSDA